MDKQTNPTAAIRLGEIACYSEIGQKANQEDSIFPAIGEASANQRVFLVCDGMGGHEHGEVASACVATTVGEKTAVLPLCTTAEMRTVFETALEAAYNELDAIDTPPSTGRTMGTTLTFAACCNDGVLVAHIGDSRVYQLRPGAGVVFRTRDHSLVFDLIAAGELTEKEARDFPQKNVITRAVQPHQERRDRASFNVITDIRPDDVFVLCSDGVVEQLTDDDLCRLMLDHDTLDNRIRSVAEACRLQQTRDNNTAYAFSIEGGSVTAQPEVKVEAVKPKGKKKGHTWVWLLLLAIIAALALFVIKTQSGDDKGDKQPAKTEQHDNNAPLRTIKHK